MSEGREDKANVLLITGMPGIGKTTVIRRVADELGSEGLRGFYTEEICEGGERLGFRLVGFEGTVHVIAHVDFPKRQRVGKYGVDVQALDSAMPLLRPDPDARVYLVDEIGKMECLSERFVAAMRALIGGSIPIIATIACARRRFHRRGQVQARVRAVAPYSRQSRPHACPCPGLARRKAVALAPHETAAAL